MGFSGIGFSKIRSNPQAAMAGFAPARRWERRGRGEHARKESWGRKERLVMLQLGDKNMCGGEEGDVGSTIYIYIHSKKEKIEALEEISR